MFVYLSTYYYLFTYYLYFNLDSDTLYICLPIDLSPYAISCTQKCHDNICFVSIYIIIYICMYMYMCIYSSE